MNSLKQNIDLSRVDLNLLVVLDVLLRERSVAQAAAKLNLTPSAISHALRRLRDLFQNELLVRDGRRMVPTKRAIELSDTLPRVLNQVARTLSNPAPFDPSVATEVGIILSDGIDGPFEISLDWIAACP